MTLIYAVLVVAQAQAAAAGWEPVVDSLVTHEQFSGVVLVARNGVPLTERAYGMADREAHRANDIETAFNVGSINKLFTQIAIRQLAVQGVGAQHAAPLHLDSTLASVWPDYPNPAVARNVTIRQILDHTSGIQGNIFAAPAGKTRHDVRTLADYFDLFKNEPLEFSPGTREQYSNAGYIVLGLLVERLSGQSYYDYVREHIFAPAGMTRTASWFVDSLPSNTAIGYTRGGERAAEGGEGAALSRNTELLPGRGSSAGGGYSTAHDLLRLLNALRAHKIAQAPEAGMVGIAGGAPGLNAAMESDLQGGYDVIVLANLDPPAAGAVSRLIRQSLGLAPPQPGRRRG